MAWKLYAIAILASSSYIFSLIKSPFSISVLGICAIRVECERLTLIMYNRWPEANHEFTSILCLDFANGKNALHLRRFTFFPSFVRLFKTTDIIYSAHKRSAHTVVITTQDEGFHIFSLSTANIGHMICAHCATADGLRVKIEHDWGVKRLLEHILPRTCFGSVERNGFVFCQFVSRDRCTVLLMTVDTPCCAVRCERVL